MARVAFDGQEWEGLGGGEGCGGESLEIESPTRCSPERSSVASPLRLIRRSRCSLPTDRSWRSCTKAQGNWSS